MTDVDFTVFENKQSGARHLAIGVGSSGETVCGIKITDKIKKDTMSMRSFWRSPKRCRNCVRAAKH